MRGSRLRPFQRVVLVTATALAIAVTLTVVMLRISAPIASEAHRLSTRYLPAQQALARTESSASDTGLVFSKLVEATDPLERSRLLDQAQKLDAVSTDAWSSYKKLNERLPGTPELVSAYEEASREARDAGTAVIGMERDADPVAYDATRTRYRSAVDRQLDALSRLRAKYEQTVTRSAAHIDDEVTGIRKTYLLTMLAVVLFGVAVTGLTLRGAYLEDRSLSREAGERERVARRSALETELQRGLEMQRTEASAFSVVAAALQRALPGLPVEMLLADAPQAHFRQVLSTDEHARGPGCPVGNPAECPATIRGQTQEFATSTGLDSCPFLRERADVAGGAVCVPVSIVGRNLGVVHMTTPPGDSPSREATLDVELVARKAGDRLGVLRVLARTEVQAQTDPLTGLPNRRSLEEQASSALDEELPYVVAFADLDHFKDLNDDHGHDVGDRALRLFARVLRDSIRPNDLPARYGGEEFVVALPDCGIEDARRVAERLRERLRDALAVTSLPPFTLSVGLAASQPGTTFTETIGHADEALRVAKSHGRNRVVVYGEPVSEPRGRDGAAAEPGQSAVTPLRATSERG